MANKLKLSVFSLLVLGLFARPSFALALVNGTGGGTVSTSPSSTGTVYETPATGNSPHCTSTEPGYPSTGTFLGLIPWYQYVLSDFTDAGTWGNTKYITPSCGFHPTLSTATSGLQTGSGNSKTIGISVIWLIVLAVLDDLLRIAGLLSVGFVIYGGIRLITSQGSPEGIKSARGTIINALIGLAIAVVAATTVSFIASTLVAK